MALDHPMGAPCWFELATPDLAAAERFYAALFGWSVGHHAMEDGSHVAVFQLDGRDVAAACPLDPAQAAAGVPPHWLVYFAVDTADAAAARAEAAGGTVVLPPLDVADMVRVAACLDPEQAVFGVYERRTHGGVDAIRERHAICWVELATRDLARAEAFHHAVFGWQYAEHHASPPGGYRLIEAQGQMVGGLLRMTEEWGEMPSHWSIYVQVDDVDATVARAVALGGVLCFPAFDAPGVGRIARINDPTGGGFYVITFVGE